MRYFIALLQLILLLLGLYGVGVLVVELIYGTLGSVGHPDKLTVASALMLCLLAIMGEVFCILVAPYFIGEDNTDG